MSSQEGLHPDGRFVGFVFRAHAANWALDALSGEGARRNGGRFNKKGVPAFYASLSILGALRESTPFGLQLQPTTICAYRVDIRPVFDATHADNLAQNELVFAHLEDPNWRAETLAGRVSTSQSVADRLIHDGYAGMLVRSYSDWASEIDHNLVLWEFGPDLPTQITLVDDDDRIVRLSQLLSGYSPIDTLAD